MKLDLESRIHRFETETNMFEIKVPAFGESIQEVQVATWLKKIGDWVDRDEDLVELDSEKASQALASPEAGILKEIKVSDGEFANVGDVLCTMQAAEKPDAAQATSSSAGSTAAIDSGVSPDAAAWIMPAAERVLNEYKISADAIKPTGPGGRLLKEDVMRYIESTGLKPDDKPVPVDTTDSHPTSEFEDEMISLHGARDDSVKPMSMIRRTIAARLVEAQHSAALLTTFNEIDMQPVMELRKKYKEPFLEKHGVKLGFMSFFTKAAVEALKRFPTVNSELRGNDVVSRNYYDIGIAIGGGKGLVVPVIKSVERCSFADIERQIGQYAALAQENRIGPNDLTGGTFTISNGGVYGSLLSTPIVNPPQSGILGLHTIQERPIAFNGEVVIRPMMYIALTYDHRLIDGREAVGFLKTIKEVLEEPARLFLEV